MTDVRVPRSDLLPGTATRLDAGPYGVCLVRIGDDFYAISDRCSHADYSLSDCGGAFGTGHCAPTKRAHRWEPPGCSLRQSGAVFGCGLELAKRQSPDQGNILGHEILYAGDPIRHGLRL